MKIELIYRKLKCGGLGYGDYLLRYKGKYYTILGYYTPGELKQLLDSPLLVRKRRNNGYTLWRKHRFDNEITAKEFIESVGLISYIGG